MRHTNYKNKLNVLCNKVYFGFNGFLETLLPKLYCILWMLEEIVNEWALFCRDMGCNLTTESGTIIATNPNSYLACDFANCAISLGEVSVDAHELEKAFKGHDYAIYGIQKKIVDEPYYAPPLKKGTLMTMNSNTWKEKARNDMEMNNAKQNPKKIFKFSVHNLNVFRDIVFDAFSYEQKFRKVSLDTYVKGERSGNVRFYGLKVLGKGVVSVAMIHSSSGEEIGGLELVSTRPVFQNMGYSKFLVSNILTEEFALYLKKIWLFSITGSVAEKFYQGLGFTNVGNIKIQRFPSR